MHCVNNIVGINEKIRASLPERFGQYFGGIIHFNYKGKIMVDIANVLKLTMSYLCTN